MSHPEELVAFFDQYIWSFDDAFERQKFAGLWLQDRITVTGGIGLR